MKRIEVVKPFRDRDRFSRLYSVGDVLEMRDELATELIARGLVRLHGENTGSGETRVGTRSARPRRGKATSDSIADGTLPGIQD